MERLMKCLFVSERVIGQNVKPVLSGLIPLTSPKTLRRFQAGKHNPNGIANPRYNR